MKGLTLTQPWATLVAIGAKTIETRGWPTHYRGDVAVHAAKGFPGWARDIVGVEPFRTVLKAAIADGRLTLAGGELPLGAIVAVARVAKVFETGRAGLDEALLEAPEHERAFGDYSPGRYGWLLADVRPLAAPVPCRGALGLWDVPDSLLPVLELRQAAEVTR